MGRSTCVRSGVTILWLALVHAAAAGGREGQPPPSQPSTPLVIVAEVDALIHPVTAEYMAQTIDRADAAGAALVVFVLRTPGGLLDSTEAIVSKMLAAKTPIAIYVAPSGARAASAGFIITIAGDIAAMAPGTHIGAAHPVSGSGEKMDETMSKKAASDTAARVRTIAAKRNRNVTLAELAVTESRAFTDQEALTATPPLIDLVAPDLNALLERLEGRTVTRFDGGTETLAVAGARVERVEMTARQRILSAIAHPQIAYLLLTLGTLGLTIELWNPGSIVPGVVGGLCLLLAFFAFQILPVNYAGLGLIFFGLLLLVLEVKIASFGLLGIGGVVSLVFGSMILIDSPLPELQIGLRLILPIVLAFAAILIPLVRLAVAAQVRRSVTGSSGMIDEPGLALTPIAPGETGQVRTRGEIWTATAAESIAEGEAIRVSGVHGLTLTVRRETGAPQENTTS
jgi:membrane-bound serine protease (ClpP class)